ncbi:MAG: hypothetical protein WBF93_19240 [Pirellulales bacterium]|nr:hypothetical protein [Pirellulales bacterium]
MAKNQNTFAKRQREMEKKRKADDKRSRRQRKKDNPDSPEFAMSGEVDEDGNPVGDLEDADSSEKNGNAA